MTGVSFTRNGTPVLERSMAYDGLERLLAPLASRTSRNGINPE